ncbi:MAG: transketolase family protein [Chloroflexi bacterium]|nr:transketolase family protein [Chloroflexota bacterium]
MAGKPTRDGFGEALLEIGKTNENIFVLTGDLADSTRAELFGKQWPDRFVNVGISESDMIGIATGLALSGKVVFACSFGCFVTTRPNDQIRVSVCYNNHGYGNLNVKIVGTHNGITTGPDGATAQAMEDIATMRVLPGMTVVVPADAVEAKKATIAVANYPGPVYLRLGRYAAPIVTQEGDPFEVGKANRIRTGNDVSIIACGLMVGEAIEAASRLSQEGIDASVINLHTVKPLDGQTLLEEARRTGAVVTAEEHQVNGGMGGAVAEFLGRSRAVPMEMVAVQDTFGESGAERELQEKYGLTAKEIVAAARKAIARKRGGLG